MAAKVWGEEPSEVEEKNEFNELGARPRPKLIENGNGNGQSTSVKPSQAYEAVKVKEVLGEPNDINWELKKNKDVK